MPIHNLSDQPSLIDMFLSELRDVNVQQDRLRFRRNIERIGEIMAYEISKTLTFSTNPIQTPLGVAEMSTLFVQPVLATILRAGLPLHQGFLNYFDKADNAFISAYRKHDPQGHFTIELGYTAGADFTARPLIMCDPMLATGQSMIYTLKALLKLAQPTVLHIACILASDSGIKALQQAFPDAHIWTAAVDGDLDEHAYIVPGLGDAGDLSFGLKMQN